MKLTPGILSLLFFLPCLNGHLTPDNIDLLPRALRVIPGNSRSPSMESNSNVSRLANAFRTIKSAQEGHGQQHHGRRSLYETKIPVIDMVNEGGKTIGDSIGNLSSKIGLNIAKNPQESTSLGLGATALGYGLYTRKSNDHRFQEINSALQNKYKLNGIYLASLEDENLQVSQCNKRLSKILDKTSRHRKDMLSKLHFTLIP